MELSFLLKNKYIQKGKIIKTDLSWTNGNEMRFMSFYSESEAYILLQYDHEAQGIKQSLNYKIKLVSVPSNLRKGKVLYFQCPSLQTKCRILYLCYGSPTFKSIHAYQNRIYYADQLSSKLEKPNNIYWKLRRHLDKLDLKCHKPYYNGQMTKSEKRLRKMKEKMEYFDQVRFTYNYLPLQLRKTYDIHQGDISKMHALWQG